MLYNGAHTLAKFWLFLPCRTKISQLLCMAKFHLMYIGLNSAEL